MKTNKIPQFLSIILIILVSFTSCSSDDDASNNSNNEALIQDVINVVQSGTWRITSFVDSGQNETSDFTGYDFTFMSNGTLSATNGGTNMNGIWSVTDSSTSSSSSDDDIDFNINFNVSEEDPFEDLNDDWDIVSYSANQLNLIDISGGNGGTDTLTFEKN